MAANYLAAFSNNLERGIPVVIIFGQQYQHCPAALEYRYSVAAVFYVTNIWATKVGKEIVRQIRYEKEFSANKSWWSPASSPAPPVVRDYSQKANVQTCSTCATSHPQVYSSHWMCLNHKCEEFDHLTSLPALNPAFLAERSGNTGKSKAPFPVTPALPKQDPNRPFDSYHLARGMVCPHCKACISKASWYGYRCITEGCGFAHIIPHIPVSQAYFNGRLQHEAIGHALPVDKCLFPVVERSSLCEGDFRTTTFDLMPGNFVVHAQGNMYANAAARGPNEIFLALQAVQGMPLERRVKDLSRNSQRELTNHFAANFGMPYSYSAKATHLSIAFSDAPDPVIASLGRLIWTAKRVLPDDALTEMLNELLLVGYMNDNSMGWHDDGEKGLGITVATLSLGGSAMMHFRLKKKYYNPAALANTELRINKYDPKRNVPVGSKLWEKRVALNEKFGKVSDAEWEEAKREMFKEYAKVKSSNKKLLEVELKHGDYLIMHGGEIQKYFEVSISLSQAHRPTLSRLRTTCVISPIFPTASQHLFPKSVTSLLTLEQHEVQSKASLRFGLTARYIDPIAHNIPAEEHHKGIFELVEDDIHD